MLYPGLFAFHSSKLHTLSRFMNHIYIVNISLSTLNQNFIIFDALYTNCKRRTSETGQYFLFGSLVSVWTHT